MLSYLIKYLVAIAIMVNAQPITVDRGVDLTINDYQMERTCFFHEMCKEEFSSKFRCHCPSWSFCSSPGRYYNAYCSMSRTGYIWGQEQASRGQQTIFYRPPPPASKPKLETIANKRLPSSEASGTGLKKGRVRKMRHQK